MLTTKAHGISVKVNENRTSRLTLVIFFNYKDKEKISYMQLGRETR